MEKRKKMLSIALVALYILVFIPVIKGTISFLGVTVNYQVNISNLNFGVGFNLIFLALMLFGLFALHLKPKLRNVSDWLIIVLVAILLGLILVAKDSSESLAIGYFVLWLDWLVIVLLKFQPSVMEKVYDFIVGVKNKLFVVFEQKSKQDVVILESQTEE